MNTRLSEKLLEHIRPILDEYKPGSMLDIGCASGVHSVVIARYCRVKYLALMDGDGSGEIFHDYREGALAWNNVADAKAFADIHLDCPVEAFVQNPDLTIPVDLITSFKSWGTHYPVSEYIPLAQRSLRSGGLIITDFRPDDEPFNEIQAKDFVDAGFRLVDRLGKSGNRRKHVFVKI